MSNVVILVENLSKRYNIGVANHSHDTLRDQIAAGFKGLFHRNGSTGSANHAEGTFWALKDVSFEVKQGDVVGVIGRNGAGKSTLLKILSRITEPTEGRINISGRVGSLLEVGTGFHGELTGRENIFLNGAILGMKKAEIERKLDEIIAFSEVEKFIDTPVKRYSSGMYVRLAFAVAAHLEPEVLIVDEVLAVGDVEFQRKCLRKMNDVAKKGRTILFVSHNMAAVRNLCSQAFLLNKGRIEVEGSTSEVIQKYLFTQQSNETFLAERQDRYGSGNIRATSFDAKACVSESSCPRTGLPAEFAVGYTARGQAAVSNLYVGITVIDSYGTNVISFSTAMRNSNFQKAPAQGTVVCRTKNFPLIPGRYWVDISLKDVHGQADYIGRAASFAVIDSGESEFVQLPSPQWGILVASHDWTLICDEIGESCPKDFITRAT